MAPKKPSKEDNIIRGLAGLVGLEETAPAFEILKAVAETLGCTVQDDGITTFSDEDEDEPSLKRPKLSTGEGSGNEGDEGSGSGGEDVVVMGSDEEDDLALEPITVPDPRKPEEVQHRAELQDGESLFQWLIAPVDATTFDDDIEEQRPLLVTREHNRGYFDGLFSKAEIDRLLRAGQLQYQYNIDVVAYKNEKRQNYNYNGKEPPEDEGEPEMADADVVWRRFGQQKCSVRVLHPQRYSDTLWDVLARLEGFLQCCVGCNAYLTPAGSQGFAPHWDDIDAYVLQLEGKKRWRVYGPREEAHVLPRYPSRDFVDSELGPCVLDVELAPGDLLYLPRGAVHQGVTPADTHSLHVTISSNQLRTWADFLEHALPRALDLAAQEHVMLRRSLPRSYLEFMGLQHELGEDEDEEGESDGEGEGQEGAGSPRLTEKQMRREARAAFKEEAETCMEAVIRSLPLDSTADQMAVQFLKSRLPPPLPERQADVEAAGGSSSGGAAARPAAKKLGPKSTVRMVAPGIARLVLEDREDGESMLVVYHCLGNSRQQHASRPGAAAAAGAAEGGQRREGKAPVEEEPEAPPGELAFPVECGEVLEVLLASGEGCEVAVADLPEVEECEEEVSALDVAKELLGAGLLEVV